jgi:hypothetical protein
MIDNLIICGIGLALFCIIAIIGELIWGEEK